MKHLFWTLILSFFVSSCALNTQHLVANTPQKTVALYGKYQASFVTPKLTAANPYRSTEVSLDALITTPSGEKIIMPMFFQSNQNNQLSWGLHFSPRQQGRYQYLVQIKSQDKLTLSAPFSFEVLPSEQAGFLHQDHNQGSWVFDNGERFRGVGLNIAWEARLSIGDDPKHTYQYFFEKMQENQINLVRTWVNAPWNIPLEWPEPNFGRYQPHTGVGLHPQAIARFDYLIEQAEKNNVNLMLTMDYHGSLWAQDFDNWGNDHWQNHPYNVKNGGPAKTPEEFFTHPEAITRYQDRLRYIIARWGYSTRIAAIEFWNEVDNAVHKKDQGISEQAVTNWHKVMSAYLTDIDPYQHIQTTSISHEEIDGLFDLEGIDFIQSHLYGRTSEEMEQFVETFSNRYNKAYVVGEAAIGWDGVNDRIDDYALALHEQLWVLMFNKTPLLPMTWWWEAYDEHNKFFHLKHAANFISQLTDTDELYENNSQVKVNAGAKHRALYKGNLHKGRSQYIWLKNITKQSKDFQVTISSSQSNPISGEYQVTAYDTWNGKTTQLPAITASSGQLVANIADLAGERDVVLKISKR